MEGEGGVAPTVPQWREGLIGGRGEGLLPQWRVGEEWRGQSHSGGVGEGLVPQWSIVPQWRSGVGVSPTVEGGGGVAPIEEGGGGVEGGEGSVP